MNVKIQNKAPFSSDNNTGTCKGYVTYLQHEKEDKEKAGILGEDIPFFDAFGDEADAKSVIDSIDGNKKQLHKTDTKYYSNIISFSDEETALMGDTREQRIEAVHALVAKMMDAYARNSNHDGVRSREDLLFYYTIHEYRGNASSLKPGLHVHMIISRKDRSNTYKLSPMTNHRKGTSGVIKHGFHRNDYYRECERIFDEHFKHERSVEQSFDYCNAMRHGTEEERAEQLRRYVAEMNLEKLITEEKVQLWRKYAEEAFSPHSNTGQTSAEQEKIRLNQFWNTFHSHYKPLLDSLKADCQMAFSIYDRAKSYSALNAEYLDAEIRKLRNCNAQIENLTAEISKANSSKVFLATFSLLLSAVNPVPAILLMIMGGLMLGFKKNAAFKNRLFLYGKTKTIRDNILILKEKQEALRYSKNDALRKYIYVKDQRDELKFELISLKKKLTETGAELELDPVREKDREYNKKKPLRRYPVLEYELCCIFNTSSNSAELERQLYYQGLSCLPKMHSNGGVADLEFIRGNECMTGSELSDHRIAVFFLDKWCDLKGFTPAYKIRAEQTRAQQQTQIHQQAQKPVQQQINKQNNGPKHRR